MMIRLTAILLAGILAGAARSSPAPSANAPVRVVVRAARPWLTLPPTPPAHARRGLAVSGAGSSFPLPPLPPTRAPAGEPAPLPDTDLSRPTSGAEAMTWHVRVFQLDEHDTGLAFIPGSAYPAPEDRKPIQTPGVTVSVPVR